MVLATRDALVESRDVAALLTSSRFASVQGNTAGDLAVPRDSMGTGGKMGFGPGISPVQVSPTVCLAVNNPGPVSNIARVPRLLAFGGTILSGIYSIVTNSVTARRR